MCGVMWIGSGQLLPITPAFDPWMQERLFVGGLIGQLSPFRYFVLDLLFGQDGAKSSISKTWRISTS